MPRYIDADRIVYWIRHTSRDGLEDDIRRVAFKDAIERIPTADVQEVKHAKNLQSRFKWTFECSHCHWCDDDTYCCDSSEFKFCPNCGAKIEDE